MVATRGQRQLMHEALRREDLGIVTRRTPCAGWDLQRQHRRAAAQVGRLDRVFQVFGEIGARGFLFAIRGESDEMFLPRVEPASLVDRALELMVAGGTIEIVSKIVLSGPL